VSEPAPLRVVLGSACEVVVDPIPDAACTVASSIFFPSRRAYPAAASAAPVSASLVTAVPLAPF